MSRFHTLSTTILLLLTASVCSAMEIKISPSVESVVVEHNGQEVVIERNQNRAKVPPFLCSTHGGSPRC